MLNLVVTSFCWKTVKSRWGHGRDYAVAMNENLQTASTTQGRDDKGKRTKTVGKGSVLGYRNLSLIGRRAWVEIQKFNGEEVTFMYAHVPTNKWKKLNMEILQYFKLMRVR